MARSTSLKPLPGVFERRNKNGTTTVLTARDVPGLPKPKWEDVRTRGAECGASTGRLLPRRLPRGVSSARPRSQEECTGGIRDRRCATDPLVAGALTRISAHEKEQPARTDYDAE